MKSIFTKKCTKPTLSVEYFLRIINWLVLAASLPNQFLLASYRDPQNILSKCDTTCISWTEWEVLNKLLNWYLHICNVKLRYWNRRDDVITSCYLEIKIYLPFSPCYRPCYCCYTCHEISDLSTITLCHYILNTSNIYIQVTCLFVSTVYAVLKIPMYTKHSSKAACTFKIWICISRWLPPEGPNLSLNKLACILEVGWWNLILPFNLKLYYLIVRWGIKLF